MDFNLSSEQELLRDGLGKFLAARYDLDKSRTAAKTGPGWQPGIWQAFAGELGILGAPLPESAGGMGGGPVEVMVIAEELGRALVIEPFIDTVVVAGGLLQRAGGTRATKLLEQIADGSAVVALASDPVCDAVRDGDDWVLAGSPAVVMNAPIATHLLIAARTGEGIGLFATTADVPMHPYRTVDDRRAADLTLDGLRLPADALIDADAEQSLQQAYDEGAAAVCAMRRVLADTVGYAKQRQQFGQPISGFQALQHRMVDMHMEVEQAVAAAYLATLTLDAEPADRARAVSAAKATIGRAARFVGQNAVQLHGGMGMTEELAIGHYFKRLTALQYEFGSTDYHRARYAQLTR